MHCVYKRKNNAGETNFTILYTKNSRIVKNGNKAYILCQKRSGKKKGNIFNNRNNNENEEFHLNEDLKFIFSREGRSKHNVLEFSSPKDCKINISRIGINNFSNYEKINRRLKISHIHRQFEKSDNFIYTDRFNQKLYLCKKMVDSEYDYEMYDIYYRDTQKIVAGVLSVNAIYFLDKLLLFARRKSHDLGVGFLQKKKIVKEDNSNYEREYRFFFKTFIPFSSGFDIFKVINNQERIFLLAMESKKGNCQLVQIHLFEDNSESNRMKSYEIIWNSTVSNVVAVSLKNLFSNLIGIFLKKNPNQNNSYQLEIRHINTTQSLSPEAHLHVIDSSSFSMMSNLFERNNICKLKFSSSISNDSNDLRLVFYNNHDKQVFHSDNNIPVYFKFKFVEITERSNIYGIIEDRNLHLNDKYKTIKMLIKQRKPKINKIFKKLEKLLITKYFVSKKDILNDDIWVDHNNKQLLDYFCEDLSTSVHENNNLDYFEVSETIFNLYFDIFQFCGCCYFTNDFRYEEPTFADMELKEKIFKFLNCIFCGMIYFINRLYLNFFCFFCTGKYSQFQNEFVPFFDKKQKKIKSTLTKYGNKRILSLRGEKTEKYDTFLNKIAYTPLKSFFSLICPFSDIYYCYNVNLGCCCYPYHVCENIKKFFNKYFFSILLTIAISITGSLIMYFLSNLVLTKTYFTCAGTLWSSSAVCSKNGYCSVTGFLKKGECICNDGWHGDDCNLSYCYGIESDDKNVCSGHGQCISYNECVCSKYPPYQGTSCNKTGSGG